MGRASLKVPAWSTRAHLLTFLKEYEVPSDLIAKLCTCQQMVGARFCPNWYHVVCSVCSKPFIDDGLYTCWRCDEFFVPKRILSKRVLSSVRIERIMTPHFSWETSELAIKRISESEAAFCEQCS